MTLGRLAVRSLARRRGLALAIVGTLALSIGATSTIFSVVDTVLLKPLPYPDPDRLVTIFETNPGRRELTSLVAAVRIEEWNRESRAFTGVAGSYFENMTDTTAPVPERVGAMRTSPRFFTVLGTPAAIGRIPQPDEEVFGGPPVVVLSDELWRSRFGGDRTIVGRTLTLGGVQRSVIGVMPASFRHPTGRAEAWIPAQAPPGLLNSREARFYTGVGRLRANVSVQQGQDDLAAIYARLGERFPTTDRGYSVAVTALKELVVGGVRTTLWLLFGAVVVVLCAACGNIAGLLLADGARREHQVAVQFALGAPRWTIVRQRLIEGVVLSSIGSLAGLLIAHWGLRLVAATATRLPRAIDLGIDVRLISFTLTVGVLSTLCFAMLPALQATRGVAAGRLILANQSRVVGRHYLHRVLVATQVAFAIVLLVGAGLVIRSWSRVQQVAPGFDPNDVIAFRMSASWNERPEAVLNRQVRTLERLRQIPGVTHAAIGTVPPSSPDGDFPPSPFTIVGRRADSNWAALPRQVSANYFATMRMPLLLGRTCEDDPRSTTGLSRVLINQAFATRFFPAENPIGQRIQLRIASEIVGVVGDAREQSLLKDPIPTMYFCGLMAFYPDPWFFVRVDPSRAPVTVTTLRQAMREIEPQRAVYQPRTMTQVLDDAASQPRLNTVLFVFFGATAILLVVIGLHGMLAQVVADRTREIGVRLALGAPPAQVLSQILGQSALVTTVGLAIGLVGAFAAVRFMSALVFAISSRDPVTFIGAPLLLAVVAIVATIIPARRAARIDPLVSLRD